MRNNYISYLSNVYIYVGLHCSVERGKKVIDYIYKTAYNFRELESINNINCYSFYIWKGYLGSSIGLCESYSGELGSKSFSYNNFPFSILLSEII